MVKIFSKLVAVLTPKRRWAQFSLLTMFVVVTVLCVRLAVVVNRAHRQREAVAAIKDLGGRVEYAKPDKKATEALPRRFLRHWLPQDYLDEVKAVDLGTQVTDAGLAHLKGMTGLLWLNLAGTQVTDDGLAHLQGLTALQVLLFDGNQVTDAGLAHLQGLTGLQLLSLTGTQVTDAGLVHLQRLTGLQQLSLTGTQVTDAGRAELQQAFPKCRIFWP